MPYKIQWDVENRVILKVYEGDVTLDEFKSAMLDTRHYVGQGKPLVHTIDDVRGVTQFPNKLRELIQAVGQVDNNIMGYTMLIGDDAMLRFLATCVTQKMKARYRMVATYQDAVDFLKDIDISLANAEWTAKQTSILPTT